MNGQLSLNFRGYDSEDFLYLSVSIVTICLIEISRGMTIVATTTLLKSYLCGILFAYMLVPHSSDSGFTVHYVMLFPTLWTNY